MDTARRVSRARWAAAVSYALLAVITIAALIWGLAAPGSAWWVCALTGASGLAWSKAIVERMGRPDA